jgi:hypothetical protein
VQAKGKTSEAITRLCQLAPPTATLLELDEEGAVLGEREVPTDLVHRGDVLKVLPGARIPTDGGVLEGSSYADESMLTGESGERRRLAGKGGGGGAGMPLGLWGPAGVVKESAQGVWCVVVWARARCTTDRSTLASPPRAPRLAPAQPPS